MISDTMVSIGKSHSIISKVYECGKKRADEIGAEKVFNFALGTPNVPAPDCIKETILELLENKSISSIHGYTSVQGDYGVRKIISDHINHKFGTEICADDIFMTVGSTASLCICIKALAIPGDEFVTLLPFFPEYSIFVEAAGGKLIKVSTNKSNTQINFKEFKNAITVNTKAVIVNSPNNPSGMVLSKDTICKLCKIMSEKSIEYGHPIYLISDDAYREIVYNDIEVPYLLNYYKDTLICNSFSKSLSLSGERIGYIVISNKIENSNDMYAAICGASRTLGYVCAPSLFQQVVARCIDKKSDISVYKKNRDILYEKLLEFGFQCTRPDGAFYLFVKAMESDAYAFCEKAKKYELYLVPGDDFGCSGYFRIAYCVTTKQIINSLPAFENLANEYKNLKSQIKV